MFLIRVDLVKWGKANGLKVTDGFLVNFHPVDMETMPWTLQCGFCRKNPFYTPIKKQITTYGMTRFLFFMLTNKKYKLIYMMHTIVLNMKSLYDHIC